jgi:putative SOS response-associated peptidase YedK
MAEHRQVGESFTIIGTTANELASQIHDRMPVILEPETFDLWLKADPDVAAALMASGRKRSDMPSSIETDQ